MLKTDLIGQRFGQLTVLEDSGERRNTSVLWRCLCDCGGEILALRHQLTGGAVTDCGCVPKKRTVFVGAEDLTGRQFGDLTVIRRAENDKHNKVCWLCKCKCGNECVVPSQRLKQGKTQSCGCKIHNTFRGKDITGQRFGRLVALFPIHTSQYMKEKTVWHCQCDCGNEVDVVSVSLLRGLTKSCGCLNREQQKNMHDHMHYTDNTCIERLIRAQTNEQENKAGFRGLFLKKDGRYRVTITFRKVRYHLGYFKNYGEAVQARLEAEEVLHGGYVKAYEKWQERAKADPEWAEQNPLLYEVVRINNEFHIVTNVDELVHA